MSGYLNHSEYLRWLRQYLVRLDQYLNRLDALRLKVATLPFVDELDKDFDEIDAALIKSIPRNFLSGSDPLKTSEVFVENIKIIINFFYKILGKAPRFVGIYQTEKDRVLKVHRNFDFEGKIEKLKQKIESLTGEEQTNGSEFDFSRRIKA